MFGIRYLKVPSTTYVLQYRDGKVVREGAGMSFFYFAPATVIVQVPVSSVDVPFVFNETSADYQDVTIQGTLTYRISEPAKLVSLMDYSVDARGRYRSEDPIKLNERLVQAAQVRTRTYVQSLPLRNVLSSSATLEQEASAGLRKLDSLGRMGIEVLDLLILSIRPSPEMGKALQTETREGLLRQADEAIYARRNASVELERTIKENELNTELAVEGKKRQIRESQMAADIAVEQQRRVLVEARAENEHKESEVRAAALRAVLEPIKEVDWRTLVAANGADSQMLVSMAFDQLAQNAGRIGELNISPDLLNSLMRKQKPPRES
jgi:hypothetical protein